MMKHLWIIVVVVALFWSSPTLRCVGQCDGDLQIGLEALPFNWTLCEDGSLAITGTLASNPFGGVVYSWNNDDEPGVFEIDHPCPSSADATITLAAGSSATVGSLTLSAVDAAGCIAQKSTSVDVLANPVINPNNIPESICIDSTETVSSYALPGTTNGQPLALQWSNSGAQSFIIQPTGGSAGEVNISVNTSSTISDYGALAFSITDGAGCFVDTIYVIQIENCSECLTDEDNNGVCDSEEVYGCTYSHATNFDSSATHDNGSCIFDPCGIGTIWDSITQTCIVDETACSWQPDGNADGLVGVSDLLDLLGVYGDTDTDQDGIWDSVDACVDSSACNYAASPTEACAYIDVLGVCGGGCEGDGDGDGICDDEDDCVGVLDECGVCNGPGPTEVVIEDIVITYDSVFLPLDNDWYVFPISADTTFTYTCAPFFGDCGDPVSYQGYDYATVLIGDQCWFAENLRSENYENGDAIPSNLSNSEWSSTTSGATTVYGESASNLETYGRLYNWYAVDDGRGLCPSGWNVPTDGEWMTMEMALGMSEAEANDTSWRGTDQGTQMKTDYGWYNGGNGTNSSGFSGLPGGYRDGNGYFDWAGDSGSWWSSSPNGSLAWVRNLFSVSELVSRSGNPSSLRLGVSVRCVWDAE